MKTGPLLYIDGEVMTTTFWLHNAMRNANLAMYKAQCNIQNEKCTIHNAKLTMHNAKFILKCILKDSEIRQYHI